MNYDHRAKIFRCETSSRNCRIIIYPALGYSQLNAAAAAKKCKIICGEITPPDVWNTGK